MFLGKSIPWNINEKHLGHVLSTSVNSVNFMDIINDMRVRTTVILKEFGHLNTWAKVNLFKSQCMSLYGCELWDLRDKNFKKICCEWRKCARLILGLSPRTHNSLIPELISSPNVESVIYSRMLSFASKGLSHPCNNINLLFRSAVFNTNSPFANNIKTICYKLNITRDELCSNSGTKLKMICRSFGSYDGETVITDSIKELINIRDGLLSCNLNFYEITDCLTHLCTV